MHDTPVGEAASKWTSFLQTSPLVILSHPFGEELKQWEQGVRVECGPDWSFEHILLAAQRGPHPSALTDEAIALFHDDIAYQVAVGFLEVIALDELLKNPRRNLRFLRLR